MKETWSADNESGDGADDPRAVGVARRAIPVVAADGGAADAWRRAARGVAWVGVVVGAITPVWFVVEAAMTGNPGVIVQEFRRVFRGGDVQTTLMSMTQVARLVLAVVLVVGSVGVLGRLRWGGVVMMAYAVGVPVPAALYVAWFALQGYGVGPVVMMALNSLHGLAFPAVVFFVMRAARPHLGKPAAGGSAFEPLSRPT